MAGGIDLIFTNSAINIGKIDIGGRVRRRIAKATMENIVIPGMKAMVRDINNDPTPFQNAVKKALNSTETVRDLLDSNSALVGALGLGPSVGYPDTVNNILDTIATSVQARFLDGGRFPAIVVGIIDQAAVDRIVNHSDGVYTASGTKPDAEEHTIHWLKWLLFGFNDPIAFKVGFELGSKGVEASRSGLALMFKDGNFEIQDWISGPPNFIEEAFGTPGIPRRFGILFETRLRRHMEQESQRFKVRSI